ncbi:TetR/AcrR family transcriptional regulator [Bradyrhizobium erythrophlei]|uniref:TetR/AcrR family transcriptional regulator n=1 Tax=Bradyrhizobium erythrophlei TaxID=1437360 RepID=UPI0035EB19D0
MSDRKSRDRGNQQYRTRKDLLAAAAQLMKQGRKPSLEEVAEAALVSRATAYRYFPDIEILLAEASIDIATPDGPTMFANDTSSDAEARLERAEAALHRAVYDNEPALRVMLASSVMVETQGVPVRQNRRLPLIEAALAPVRSRLDRREYERLCNALCLIFGPEAMIVFKDVLRIDEQATRDVKAWAIRALVRAALDSKPTRGARSAKA